MRYAGYVLLLIIFIFVCLLAVLNTQSVRFNYIFGKLDFPLIIFALLCFVLGLIIGTLFTLITRKRHKNKHPRD